MKKRVPPVFGDPSLIREQKRLNDPEIAIVEEFEDTHSELECPQCGGEMMFSRVYHNEKHKKYYAVFECERTTNGETCHCCNRDYECYEEHTIDIVDEQLIKALSKHSNHRFNTTVSNLPSNQESLL